MSQFKDLKKLLHGDLDIYENFDHTQYDNTLSPGSMPANELLQSVVEQIKPKLIIEVGSFLGYSAWGMAKKMKEINSDGVIICVDSWMGGSDHWNEIVNTSNSRIQKKNGYPTFYYNFLANMCYNDMQETVIPFAYPSVTAAAILQNIFLVLREEKIYADMIYVDGSHLYDDVLLDCKNFWPLLKDGGIIFGDDWGCEGVNQAVRDLAESNNIKLEIHPNNVHWFLYK